MLGPLNPIHGLSTNSVSLSKAARLKPPVPGEMASNATMTPLSPDEEKSTITEVLFDGYLKYKTYRVELVAQGRATDFKGGFVHGPGHHSTAMAALVFDRELRPYVILKTGDARLSRADREEPYVQDGFVAGRMDKEGMDSSGVVLAELAEEVGAEVVPHTFRPLGEELTPTMPLESTECDAYYLAAVHLVEKPLGDGGKMEVPALIGAKLVEPKLAISLMDEGKVSDAGRARTLYGRGFNAIGYLPELGLFVQDVPALLERYDTLGLGVVQDIRSPLVRSTLPSEESADPRLEAQVNDVTWTAHREIRLSQSHTMIDALTRHAVSQNGKVTPLGEEFTSQYLKLNYDRVKMASYYRDPVKGPMVKLLEQPRPALAFAPGKLRIIRRDVADLAFLRERPVEPGELKEAKQLGRQSGASSGQSDLYYQYWAKEVPAPERPLGEGFVPLAEAISLCRSGHGDAQSEALLLRLADELHWIPTLGMSVEDARAVLDLQEGQRTPPSGRP